MDSFSKLQNISWFYIETRKSRRHLLFESFFTLLRVESKGKSFLFWIYFSVEVFKCRFKALDCGHCLLLDEAYDCIWCIVGCMHMHSPDCKNPAFLQRGAQCLNPRIDSVRRHYEFVVLNTVRLPQCRVLCARSHYLLFVAVVNVFAFTLFMSASDNVTRFDPCL